MSLTIFDPCASQNIKQKPGKRRSYVPQKVSAVIIAFPGTENNSLNTNDMLVLSKVSISAQEALRVRKATTKKSNPHPTMNLSILQCRSVEMG
jgi:hypothetical protein